MAKNIYVESINTKLPPELSAAFESACESHGLTGYDVLQRMILSFLRNSSKSVALSPEMRLIIQDYGRYEDDSVKLITGKEANIIRAIYVVAGKSQRASVIMTDNSLTSETRVDVNIHHIFELIVKVCFPDIHHHLKELQTSYGLPSLATTIRHMIDLTAEDSISRDIEDLFSDNERADDGGQFVYGQRFKQKKRRTMESVKQGDLFEDQVLGQIFSRAQSKEDSE